MDVIVVAQVVQVAQVVPVVVVLAQLVVLVLVKEPVNGMVVALVVVVLT